jgi:hypothetical protein
MTVNRPFLYFLRLLTIALLGLCILQACERSGAEASDEGLWQMAGEENVSLAAAFGVAPMRMESVTINWGAVSQADGRCITINRDVMGGPFVRAHVREEVFHALSGLLDGAVYYNGIRIRSVVASWEESA